MAGHSLGEYSGLAAMGALSIADTVRLVKRRGQAMQEAVPVGEGAMAALLGLDLETTGAVAREAADGEVCAAANDNAPGQIVISGHKSAVERAVEIAQGAGAPSEPSCYRSAHRSTAPSWRPPPTSWRKPWPK